MPGRPARAESFIEGPAGQVKEEFRVYPESHWDLRLDFKLDFRLIVRSVIQQNGFGHRREGVGC